LIILAFTEEDELVGYWPLLERPGLLGSKGLWPFIYDEANYHFPTCVKESAPLLVDSLHQLIGSFLFVWLPQIPKIFWDDSIEPILQKSPSLRIVRQERASSKIKPVDGMAFDDFWQEQIGAKTRKSFAYDQRALASRGEVTYETATTFEEVRSVMPSTCLVELESSKTQENAGLYTIRGKRGFFFELLPQLASSREVRVSFLRVDEHPVAWQLELLSPGHTYLHHLAFDQSWKKYSPGKQLLHHCLARCWQEGRTFDFLPASFAYKETYANESMPAHELHWIRNSIRGRIARRLICWNMNWRKKMRERSPGLAATIAREEVSKANQPDTK
jgi:CelD/BcsL family acetyltransferase involved in cellulose biosynthesis